MNDIKPWNGEDLKGRWEVTLKIDGVQAINTEGRWLSRAGKPLYNMPNPMLFIGGHYEVFLRNLKDTVRAVRTKHVRGDTPSVRVADLFMLYPYTDERLRLIGLQDPPAKDISTLLRAALGTGYEGLVLRSIDDPSAPWLKVKPSDTLDLLVTGYEVGEGKHAGRLGALLTSKGRVGTGFTDAERQDFWDRRAYLIGKVTIEVGYMHLTPDGKMRHPRFIRERFDKIATE